MKITKLHHSHSPTNTNRPLKQDDNEEEQNETQKQDDQHAKEPYILQLPDYVIFEIFYKIHIPTIIQCRFVCKSWLRLLSDPYFTKTLCSRTPPSLIVSGISKDHYLVGLDEASRPNGDVTELFGGNEHTLINIVGSCNGLLCLNVYRHHGYRFYLSNPITGESLALPEHNNYPHKCGFGFSPVSNVYKVVLTIFSSPPPERNYDECDLDLGYGYAYDVLVLTVGSSVWRNNIKKYALDFGNEEDGIYLNGFLHWVWNGSNFIWAFDVERELFQPFPPPPLSFEETNSPQIRGAYRLVVLRASLSLIVPNVKNVSVWVMKDYGVKESWTKELEIVNDYYWHIPRVLKFTEEGQVLLVRRHKLKAYTPGKMGFSKVEVDGLPERVAKGCVHIPSFASLKDIIRS